MKQGNTLVKQQAKKQPSNLLFFVQKGEFVICNFKEGQIIGEELLFEQNIEYQIVCFSQNATVIAIPKQEILEFFKEYSETLDTIKIKLQKRNKSLLHQQQNSLFLQSQQKELQKQDLYDRKNRLSFSEQTTLTSSLKNLNFCSQNQQNHSILRQNLYNPELNQFVQMKSSQTFNKNAENVNLNSKLQTPPVNFRIKQEQNNFHQRKVITQGNPQGNLLQNDNYFNGFNNNFQSHQQNQKNLFQSQQNQNSKKKLPLVNLRQLTKNSNLDHHNQADFLSCYQVNTIPKQQKNQLSQDILKDNVLQNIKKNSSCNLFTNQEKQFSKNNSESIFQKGQSQKTLSYIEYLNKNNLKQEQSIKNLNNNQNNIVNNNNIPSLTATNKKSKFYNFPTLGSTKAQNNNYNNNNVNNPQSQQFFINKNSKNTNYLNYYNMQNHPEQQLTYLQNLLQKNKNQQKEQPQNICNYNNNDQNQPFALSDNDNYSNNIQNLNKNQFSNENESLLLQHKFSIEQNANDISQDNERPQTPCFQPLMKNQNITNSDKINNLNKDNSQQIYNQNLQQRIKLKNSISQPNNIRTKYFQNIQNNMVKQNQLNNNNGINTNKNSFLNINKLQQFNKKCDTEANILQQNSQDNQQTNNSSNFSQNDSSNNFNKYNFDQGNNNNDNNNIEIFNFQDQNKIFNNFSSQQKKQISQIDSIQCSYTIDNEFVSQNMSIQESFNNLDYSFL
ncbi:Cyclic nucleotide-binding protein [Pseudocohnilembus persalinus]|uniref:Cyclic nucleotide-binding protein n=1 Tax=Pseudocohnilembus persalinus TaxID=266149 RepID=A0A0V0QDR3_PSEPJ|nr:Cyclic nucleotide-binding protein [Pseudocohnilembus persalinus]|eukprot:KRX00340.1 Cyclic nucleotide-binding protein [Pseudocohnilembus persalinus]